MRDHFLLRSQMNEVFREIQKAGFDPVQFTWEEHHAGEGEGLPVHRLVHQPSGFFFTFDISDVTYSPGYEARVETLEARDWLSKLSKVPVWLRHLKRETDAPDLWSTLSQEKELLTTESSDVGNTPFTTVERDRITLVVNEIRAYLITTDIPSGETFRSVNAKLDYLLDASIRLGRIHWKDIFVSTVIGIAVQLSLSGDQTHEFLRFTGQLLRQLLGPVLTLPTPP